MAHPSRIVVRSSRPSLVRTARKLGVSKKKLVEIQRWTAKALKPLNGTYVIGAKMPPKWQSATTAGGLRRHSSAAKKRKS